VYLALLRICLKGGDEVAPPLHLALGIDNPHKEDVLTAQGWPVLTPWTGARLCDHGASLASEDFERFPKGGGPLANPQREYMVRLQSTGRSRRYPR
jgi:hypothetical protein